jgi:hypothetical protein
MLRETDLYSAALTYGSSGIVKCMQVCAACSTASPSLFLSGRLSLPAIGCLTSNAVISSEKLSLWAVRMRTRELRVHQTLTISCHDSCNPMHLGAVSIPVQWIAVIRLITTWRHTAKSKGCIDPEPQFYCVMAQHHQNLFTVCVIGGKKTG